MCHQLFNSTRDRKFHLRTTHKIGQPFKCAHCGLTNTFKDRHVYYNHVKKCKAIVDDCKTAASKAFQDTKFGVSDPKMLPWTPKIKSVVSLGTKKSSVGDNKAADSKKKT